MPASLNRVFLIGNLTRDPELRYVPSGTAVASFTLAVNRYYTTNTGERKEEASFVRIVVWGKRAELCGEYLSKGSPVFVEGRLRSRSWETPDGQKRAALEVVALSVQFLRSGRGQQAQSAGDMPPEAASADRQAPEDIAMGQDAGPHAPADEVPF